MQPNLLYHGSCAAASIFKSGALYPLSGPEYDFPAPNNILSLTRCFDFAASYASQIRDEDPSPAVFIFDRQLLRTTHKITLARSTIYDSHTKAPYNRSECEEFVSKEILLNHPAYLGYVLPKP